MQQCSPVQVDVLAPHPKHWTQAHTLPAVAVHLLLQPAQEVQHLFCAALGLGIRFSQLLAITQAQLVADVSHKGCSLGGDAVGRASLYGPQQLQRTGVPPHLVQQLLLMLLHWTQQSLLCGSLPPAHVVCQPCLTEPSQSWHEGHPQVVDKGSLQALSCHGDDVGGVGHAGHVCIRWEQVAVRLTGDLKSRVAGCRGLEARHSHCHGLPQARVVPGVDVSRLCTCRQQAGGQCPCHPLERQHHRPARHGCCRCCGGTWYLADACASAAGALTLPQHLLAGVVQLSVQTLLTMLPTRCQDQQQLDDDVEGLE